MNMKTDIKPVTFLKAKSSRFAEANKRNPSPCYYYSERGT